MKAYSKQLKGVCKRAECKKVFCRKVRNQKLMKAISGVLEEFGRMFLCENIGHLLANNPETSKSTSDNHKNSCSSALSERSYTSHHIIGIFFQALILSQGRPTLVKSKRASHFPFPTHKGTACDHSHCEIYVKKLSQSEKYIFLGITHLLLARFPHHPSHLLAAVVIRCFLLSSRFSSIDHQYFPTLEVTFRYLLEKPVLEAERNSLPGHRCLFVRTLDRIDIVECLEIITDIIDCSKYPDIREDKQMYYLLNILRILYEANKKIEAVTEDAFLLPRLCERINLRKELSYNRINISSILDFPFVLPLHKKADFIKLENNESMKNILQEAFFRSLFEGMTKPYLFVTVSRENIYNETIKVVNTLPEEELKKQIKVEFSGEEGVDSGGLKKEFFKLLSQKIMEDNKAFEIKNGRLWFRPGGSLSTCNALGKILGIALYNDAVLNVSFPLLLFKYLVGGDAMHTFEDLGEIEPENYRSLTNLKRCTPEELKKADIYFTVDYTVNNVTKVKELIPNGSETRVTKENLEFFCQKYASFFTTQIIKNELSAFSDGFLSVIHTNLLGLLSPKELERLIIGEEEINVDFLEKYATYTGYTGTSSIIRGFWDIFKSFSTEHKKALLQFITGNDRIPISSEGVPKLIIVRNGGDTDRLPGSQTCFNTFLLPEYSSKKKLQEKVLKAIQMAAGFYLV